MEINAGAPPAVTNNYLSTTSSGVSPANGAAAKTNNVGNPDTILEQLKSPDKEEKKFTNEDVDQVADSLNKFMRTINADLQFRIHEETQRLMVQVVDTKKSTSYQGISLP